MERANQNTEDFSPRKKAWRPGRRDVLFFFFFWVFKNKTIPLQTHNSLSSESTFWDEMGIDMFSGEGKCRGFATRRSNQKGRSSKLCKREGNEQWAEPRVEPARQRQGDLSEFEVSLVTQQVWDRRGLHSEPYLRIKTNKQTKNMGKQEGCQGSYWQSQHMGDRDRRIALSSKKAWTINM